MSLSILPLSWFPSSDQCEYEKIKVIKGKKKKDETLVIIEALIEIYWKTKSKEEKRY